MQGIYPEHAVFMVPLPSLGRSPPSAFFLCLINAFTVIPRAGLFSANYGTQALNKKAGSRVRAACLIRYSLLIICPAVPR